MTINKNELVCGISCFFLRVRHRTVDEKPLINLVIVGHVDAGKSTLMGHLLYQVHRIPVPLFNLFLFKLLNLNVFCVIY